jgi:UDP-2-acetamido-3-amino-2,3-dideoxy-glucuronate N-acetyltransferase
MTSPQSKLEKRETANVAPDSKNEKRETKNAPTYFVHESSYVDDGAQVGRGTKVWHFSHIMPGAIIGEGCSFGQNVNVAGGVVIGNNVKVQNNVSIYTGTEIEDDVFLGPSCVLTNVTNPRSQVNRHSLYEKTLIRRGATIGANATIVCGITIGRYAFIAAGAVIAKDVPDYAMVMGVPARQTGWMSRHGHILNNPDESGTMTCPESGYRYQLKETPNGPQVVCLDLDEEAPLPVDKASGAKCYDDFKMF